MKELPRIFTTGMVKAILESRKTQTRRLDGLKEINKNPDAYEFLGIAEDGKLAFFRELKDGGDIIDIKVPVQIGDHMYVREKFRYERPFTGNMDFDLTHTYVIFYASDHEKYRDKDKWKSPYHMFKEDARIWRVITDVRFERVQNITEDDAIQEGIGNGFQMNSGWPDYQHMKNGICEITQDSAVMSFSTLWDSINAKRGYPFSLNPWVRAETFKILN